MQVISDRVSVAAVLLLTVLPITAVAQDAPSAQVAAQNALAIREEAERLLALTPSLDDVLDAADYDAAAIVDHVRDGIAYRAYDGVLQGVDGTIAAGSGNSWDQAITLSAMLSEAGYDAYVAYGTPPDGMTWPSVDPTPPDARAAALFGPQFVGSVDETSAHLLGVIDRSGASLSATGGGESSYAWVQFRETSAEPYRDVHPVFGQHATPEVDILALADGTVPPELVHRISFRPVIVIEQGGDFSRRVVGDVIEGAAANFRLDDVTITFNSMAALGVALDPPADAQDAAAAAEMLAAADAFEAGWNDGPWPGSQIFNLRGQILDAETAASAMAPLFETVAEDAGRAAEALAALGVDEGADVPEVLPRLAGAGIEITVVAPGAEPIILERWFLNPDLPFDAEANGLDDLTQVMSLGIVPGLITPDEAEATAYVDTARLLEAYAGLAAGASDADRLQSLPIWEAAGETRLMSRAGVRLDMAARLAGGQAERSGPLMIARWDRTRLDEAGLIVGQRVIFDVLHNPSRGVAEQVLRRGVSETLAEASLAPGENVAFRSGAAVNLAGTPDLRLVSPEEIDGIAPIARNAIRRDLESGHLVLLNAAMPDDPHWWRVDPRTGETLGRSGAGYGSQLTEYVVMLTVPVQLAKFVKSAMDCSAKHGRSNTNAAIYCRFCAAAGLIAGLAMRDPVGLSNDIACFFN
ncbi:hypothetical protein [Roseobacter sp. HKCCA0434]|uniref:hypothetical protein n=1 Tax=Roseobacter sp. HKCCA0434 TaxID=3079297 RepID=UPI002905EC20|nr:hypothetical protein [Roseobacter sp. HKCCA0434]